jgi:hypothetical protein
MDIMYFNIVDYHSLFLSFLLPKFHIVVPLLQTCTIYKFVCDHVCFCVYVCLLDLSSTWEKTCGLCLSEPGLLHLPRYPPVISIYL